MELLCWVQVVLLDMGRHFGGSDSEHGFLGSDAEASILAPLGESVVCGVLQFAASGPTYCFGGYTSLSHHSNSSYIETLPSTIYIYIGT